MKNKCFKVYIYPKAEKDMERIFEYISNELYSPQSARKLIDKFYEAIEQIRLFPESCPLSSNEIIIDKTLRKLIVENYIIFYKPIMEQRKINIIRVIYGMKDIFKIL